MHRGTQVEDNSVFLNELNSEVAKEFLLKVLDMGLEFKTQRDVRAGPWVSPESVAFSNIPEQGLPLDVVLKEFQRISMASTNFSSPNFVGFPDAGNSIAALGASVLVPMLNQNLINQDFCAPIATFIEMETIHWLRNLIGYSTPAQYKSAIEIGGCSVHGGVLANTTALLAAREAMYPGTLQKGILFDTRRIKILVPKGIGHYSVRMALAWLGLGESALVEIPVTSNYQIDISCLEAIISQEIKLGNEIMAVVAYAGDSRTMSVDNLEDVANVLNKRKIWFHVDACHGVQLLFSSKFNTRMKGLQYADSVSIDPHKVLWIPYACSYVLFKEQVSLKKIASSSDLITKEKWSLGQTTPFIGSKAFNSLKFWSMAKSMGRKGIGEMIDKRIDFTQQIRQRFEDHPDFLLLNDTDINSVMFMYVPGHLQKSEVGYGLLTQLNEVNLAIKTKILEEGKFYLHGFPIPSSGFCQNLPAGATLQVLRIMSGNPNTVMEDLEALIDAITAIGKPISDRKFGTLKKEKEIRSTPIFSEFVEWLKVFMGDVEHVSIVYGSSVQFQHFFTSDIDLMIIAEDSFCTSKNIALIQEKVISLHKKYNLRIDEEVPFERKLLIPVSFAQNALAGTGFSRVEDKIVIPPIIKTTEFLSSDAMIARLFLNAVTTKNVLLSGDFGLFHQMRQDALRLLVWIVMSNIQPISNSEELFENFLSSGERSGEDYLGYKRGPLIEDHLRPLLHDAFNEMVKKNQIISFKDSFYLEQKFHFLMLEKYREN